MKINRSLSVFFVGLLVVAGLLITTWPWEKKEQGLYGLLLENGLSLPGAKDFRLRKNLLREGGSVSFRSLEAVRGRDLLKVEIFAGLSEAEAARTVTERVEMIRSLFVNLPSPYPGMVTHKVSVDESLRPRESSVEVEGARLPLYLLVSNDRHTYGAMDKDQATSGSGLLFLYDRATQALYRFDYFLPREDQYQARLEDFFGQLRLTSGNTPEFPALNNAAVMQSEPLSAGQPPAVVAGNGPNRGPNLIIIGFEPLGANHVGCYGYTKPTTPNLDRFAKEACLFENAVSASSWTLPAFMSWFTSLYPTQHRITNKYSQYTDEHQVLANLGELSPGVLTMAEVLRRQGFRTASFTGGAALSHDFGYGQGFEEYFDEGTFGGFDRAMPLALKWLGKHKEERFFLFVQGFDVHGRFPLNRQTLAKFVDKNYQGKYTGSPDDYWALRNKNIDEGHPGLSDTDMDFWKAVYDAKIFEADKRFGNFVARLEEMGLLENSIIVVSSGSGNEFGEHGRIDHGFSLYDELIKVPLIIRVPGNAGRRVRAVVGTIDMMPTVLELLRVKVVERVESQMQGTSLVPLIQGSPLHHDVFSETDYLLQAFRRSISSADGWKFIITLDTETRELYNLNDDPGEQRNLVRDEPRKAYELEEKLFAHLQEISGKGSGN